MRISFSIERRYASCRVQSEIAMPSAPARGAADAGRHSSPACSAPRYHSARTALVCADRLAVPQQDHRREWSRAGSARGATGRFTGRRYRHGRLPTRRAARELLLRDGASGTDDFTAEQSYFLRKIHRLNRMLHGAGVATGLKYTLEGTGAVHRSTSRPVWRSTRAVRRSRFARPPRCCCPFKASRCSCCCTTPGAAVHSGAGSDGGAASRVANALLAHHRDLQRNARAGHR